MSERSPKEISVEEAIVGMLVRIRALTAERDCLTAELAQADDAQAAVNMANAELRAVVSELRDALDVLVDPSRSRDVLVFKRAIAKANAALNRPECGETAT